MENQNNTNEMAQQSTDAQVEKQDVVIEVTGLTLFGNPQHEIE